MSGIVLKNICKQYDGEHYAVKNFNLDIQDREFIIFVIPPAAESLPPCG